MLTNSLTETARWIKRLFLASKNCGGVRTLENRTLEKLLQNRFYKKGCSINFAESNKSSKQSLVEKQIDTFKVSYYITLIGSNYFAQSKSEAEGGAQMSSKWTANHYYLLGASPKALLHIIAGWNSSKTEMEMQLGGHTLPCKGAKSSNDF